MDFVLRPAWDLRATRDRLSAHIEDALRGREAKHVLRHLARCPHRREALRSLARNVDGLLSLRRSDASSVLGRPSDVNAVVDRIRSNSS